MADSTATDEQRCERRPAWRPPARTETTEARLTRAITIVLEALEVGDQYLASVTLLEALEGPAPARRFPCPHSCGFTAEWPGQVDAHVYGFCPVADRELAA